MLWEHDVAGSNPVVPTSFKISIIMASPTDIRKGKVLDYLGHPHLVLEMQHRTQGRQAGFVQVTLRNLHTGSSTTTKFRTTDSVEFCHTQMRTFEFSYIDDLGYHFMNPETFEDIILEKALVEEHRKFLVENAPYDILFVDDNPVEVVLHPTIEMLIKEAPEGLRGDTASSAQKPATTESGLVVQVPLFVKPGDRIRISTDSGTYLGRC